MFQFKNEACFKERISSMSEAGTMLFSVITHQFFDKFLNCFHQIMKFRQVVLLLYQMDKVYNVLKHSFVVHLTKFIQQKDEIFSLNGEKAMTLIRRGVH